MLPQSMTELEEVRFACQKIVKKRAKMSSIAAIVPIPGLDVGTDVTIMFEIIQTINEKFGLSEKELKRLDAPLRDRVLLIATAIGSDWVGKALTKKLVSFALKKWGQKLAVKYTVKWVPLAGQALAATISYAAVRQLGYHHIEQCYEICLATLREQGIE